MGAAIEELDIPDLEKALVATDNQDVVRIYGNPPRIPAITCAPCCTTRRGWE